MTERISGDGDNVPSITPQQKKMYEKEYRQAADLFEKSLNEYARSDNPYQKEEFKKVMEESMQILKETASELRRQELLKQNNQIEKDYVAYQSNGSDDSKNKLENDLDRAKKLS